MQTDYLQFIFQAINNLLTQNLGFFDAMGQNLFRMFATILVAWFGIKSALSASSGRGGFHFENFASLLLTISFGFAMVNYYSNPIPGMGTSFHNLITDESQFLANRITQTQLQVVIERVADFESRMDSPGFGDFLGTLIYTAVTILLAAAQAIAIVVIAYGFIATAVCVLVGPIFIPFFIVPTTRMDLLGMVQGVHPIRLLPGHRRSRRVHHRESHSRHDESPAERNNLDDTTPRILSRPLHYVLGVHLRPLENSRSYQPHLQRQLRRVFRRHIGGMKP